MTLYSAPASPFGRRVKMTAILKGVMDGITVEAVDTSRPDNDVLKRRNPLQKIPVLVLPDGDELYDSRVICDYLDSLAPEPRLIPSAGPDRLLLELGHLSHNQIIDPQQLPYLGRRLLRHQFRGGELLLPHDLGEDRPLHDNHFPGVDQLGDDLGGQPSADVPSAIHLSEPVGGAEPGDRHADLPRGTRRDRLGPGRRKTQAEGAEDGDDEGFKMMSGLHDDLSLWKRRSA